MSNTSSANFSFSFSDSYGTAKPSDSLYFRKNYSYVPQGPALYRLNMPLQFTQYQEITPVPVGYYLREESKFDICLNDALKRYREINNSYFDITKVSNFLHILRNVCNNLQIKPYIIFNKFAAKIQFEFNENNFTLDFDYDDLDNVFILSPINGTIIVKECLLDNLERTIRAF